MLNLDKRRVVDLLVEQFWKHGFLTLSRRYGTYLPEPAKIGNYDVDIIAKQKKNIAIGITLTENDFNNSGLQEKIAFLASRQTRYSNKPVMLFIGVHSKLFKNAKALIDLLAPEIKKNIRLIQIIDRLPELPRKSKDKGNVLFS